MVNDDNSPDPDISINSPTRSMPQFTGVTLPTPLLELQRKENNPSQTPHPSELTALAVRLRKIRLDSSPNSEPVPETPTSNNTKPVRLQFDDEDPALDKENVENTAAVVDPIKPIKSSDAIDKPDTNPLLRPEAADSEDDAQEGLVDEADGDKDDETKVEQPLPTCDTAPDEDDHNPGLKLHAIEAGHTNDSDPVAPQSEPAPTENNEATPETSSFVVEESNEQASATEPTFAAGDISESIDQSADDRDEQPPYSVEEQSQSLEAPEPEATEGAQISINENIPESAEIISDSTEMPAQNSDEVMSAKSEPVDDAANDSVVPNSSSDATENDAGVVPEENNHADESSPTVDTVQGETKDETTCHIDSQVEEMRGNLDIVIEGQDKWSWQKRCDAMRDATRTLSGTRSEGVYSTVRKLLPQLSIAINANLDELRPSIMSSALNLTNAIVRSRIDNKSDFAEQVFPSIMDLGCGRSITSQEGSRSLALLLDVHPELSNILEDADNPSRLQQLLEADEKSELVGEDVNLRAKKASAILRKTLGYETTAPAPLDTSTSLENAAPVETQKEESDEGNHSNHIQSSIPPSPVPSNAPAESPRVSSRSVNARFSQRLNAISGSPIVGDDFALSRAARRSFQMIPSGLRATPRHSVRLGSEGHPATPVVRNMKLGESVRKVSPGARMKRIYTEEDMEEARRAAMRVVMEEVSQAHAKEREKLQDEKAALEKQVEKEKSDVADLKSVLEEFELTMQKMVSQGNTQASAYCAALEKETKKLKAELLEATEAYETVKERYDAGKQALKVYENKETRSIEQIRELKKNMSELQKWSNELKANTEKKLAKAFENVTSYRASFLEMEARLSKAKSDMDRLRAEHDKEVANHSETASALARVEKLLHSEQDARSSLEASLSTTKASLSRTNMQKERMQREFSEAQDELKRVSSEASKLKDADVRAKNASKQLESYANERQSMKARAYDDMSRIRELENLLSIKDKEYNELNAITEEALSQLEKMKMGQ